MKFKCFSKNGRVLSIKEAQIPINNIEYSYGFGVYETIRVNKKVAYFSNQHINRLINSAKIIGLRHNFSGKDIEIYIRDLISAIQLKTYNLKIFLIGAKKIEDVLLFLIPLNPLFPDKKMYKFGVNTITSFYERPFPNAKTLNMLQSYLAYKKAKENNCYDALIVDRQGCIREGTRSNFLAIKNKTIFVSPKDKILNGVTQRNVLNIARKNGFCIKESNIKFSDLSKYEGAFLTSTSFKIMPILKIDNFTYPFICPQIKNLMKKYNDFQNLFFV